jgi:hypothetical protein
MIFEAAFCLSFAAVARILRAYKRRQDVLNPCRFSLVAWPI